MTAAEKREIVERFLLWAKAHTRHYGHVEDFDIPEMLVVADELRRLRRMEAKHERMVDAARVYASCSHTHPDDNPHLEECETCCAAAILAAGEGG